MDFVLIDYSLSFYKKTAKKTMPAGRSGKFVQIRDLSTEYLVLSNRELSPYHADIAERFFLERGIGGDYNRKRDHYLISDPEWEIIGGGMWSVDSEGLFCLSGRSQAYGRFDPGGLKERLRAALDGYRIEVL
jgi:hypothetical protein